MEKLSKTNIIVTMMKKILVIGGSGFLGQHLIEALLADGRDVRCLDVMKPKHFDKRMEFIEGSFMDSKVLERALSDCKVVFHLASTTIPKTSNLDPIFDINTNLRGTVQLLDQTIKCNINKFIFISSGGTVYGIPTTLPVSEDHATNPICSYGIIKLAIEKYLHLYHYLHGLNTCILRLSNPYGRYQRIGFGQGALTTFCHKALSGETIEIWGDGCVVRDFIYVSDAVRAMINALNKDISEQVFNIGYGTGISINQIILMIEESLGYEIKKRYCKARTFDVPEIYLDIRRAKQFLDWEPKVSPAAGIEKMISELRH